MQIYARPQIMSLGGANGPLGENRVLVGDVRMCRFFVRIDAGGTGQPRMHPVVHFRTLGQFFCT